MDGRGMINALTRGIKRYKYALLVLLIGLALMLFPFSPQKQSAPESQETIMQETPSLAEELSAILSQIQGAGKVEVLLSVEKGEQVLYQTDTEPVSGENGGSRVTTVVITNGERSQTGLICQVLSPTYLGAVVLCQGANDPGIKLAIVNAVSNITGITSDKISVLKMK